jgi:DNA primase
VDQGARQGARQVYHRVPQVIEAIANSFRIACVEGEKDVDNLWKVGIPATCNPDGASEPGKKPKWRREHSEWLRADLIVTGDNDDAGRVHIEATVASQRASRQA